MLNFFSVECLNIFILVNQAAFIHTLLRSCQDSCAKKKKTPHKFSTSFRFGKIAGMRVSARHVARSKNPPRQQQQCVLTISVNRMRKMNSNRELCE
jgi:hypothetical protein